jgi:hypothetical protein
MYRGGTPGEFGYGDWFGFRGCRTPSLVFCLEFLTNVIWQGFKNGHIDLGE